ncbi:glycosyltransferase family 2 protein [Hwangdonia sp.]|uniref:glycosyltransferase family 2 protein n=1 Tax=Hwangdonia sp. TaxID=1883432 RepID=UPI003AB7988D
MESKNKNPLVTIGIPFYNSEKYLAYAINSVLMQSYSNWELLLMDDGSKDNSVTIAKNFELTDSRIKVYSDGKNFKLPTRLNQLSKLAKGQFYARMDADDMMHPNRIQTQVDYLINHPEVDLLGTGLVAIDGDNKIIGIRKGKAHAKFLLKEVLFGGWCVHPTITGKTEWFKNNKYDETLTRTEDFDLWIRTVEKSHFCKIDFLGLYYREESELSLKKFLISIKQVFKLNWKNRKTIGYFYVMLSYPRKIFKLLVYLFFHYTGLMDSLVKRRSGAMNIEDVKHHNRIIKDILQNN